VAGQTAITDLVDSLSAGWATPLDKTMPGGADLSGGEWQRLGLARAVRAVEEGAGLLVLDEPSGWLTSSWCSMADGCGRSGPTHTELLESGGRYAELFSLQARGYR
jgi:hypothetical protein